MKYRLGFVSNSSTTSFTCEVCGASESGFDFTFKDVGMVSCVNEHTICEEEVMDFDIEKLDNADYMDGDGRYYLPAINCPICNFTVITDSDIANYLRKKYKVNRDAAFAAIKQQNKRRKLLRDSEYISYVISELTLNIGRVYDEIRAFDNYEAFKSYLASKDC